MWLLVLLFALNVGFANCFGPASVLLRNVVVMRCRPLLLSASVGVDLLAVLVSVLVLRVHYYFKIICRSVFHFLHYVDSMFLCAAFAIRIRYLSSLSLL